MKMTDIITEIMVKNMAREMVKRATAKNAALREVAVTYSDGTTITTSMAAHLSDADIKNYFRVGREFNIGGGGKDKMAKVKSVKILNTVKNVSAFTTKTDVEKMIAGLRNELRDAIAKKSKLDRILREKGFTGGEGDTYREVKHAIDVAEDRIRYWEDKKRELQ